MTTTRRLAATLAADVAGYSRPTGRVTSDLLRGPSRQPALDLWIVERPIGSSL
jgi:hypothetical protein